MSKLAITVILAVYLILALAYGIVIPPFEGLDEIEHFGAVRYVADTGRLPVQGEPALAAYPIRQEASQPPLYYLAAGPLLRLTNIATADTADYLVRNPYVTCGTENIRANKAVLRHDPFAEAFPWRDALLALHLLRGLSAVLQALTVVGVYGIARRVLPGQPGIAALAAALTAFNPQFLIVASNVNNDNMATPVITWAVYLCVVVAQEGLALRRALRRALLLGILIGLAALSKLTGLLLLPLLALAWIANLKAHSANLPAGQIRSAIRDPAIAVGMTLAVSGWWYLRNWQLYGDPTGLSPMLDIVGRRGPVPLNLLISELSLVFRSYWGQFPCAFFDSELYYWVWVIVVILGLVGMVIGLRRRTANTLHTLHSALYVLPAWFALVLIGWLRWNLTTPAPGGRLLFTAVGATSVLLAFGLASLPSPFSSHSCAWSYAGSFIMACLGVLALLAWVRPLFAPPPMMDAANIRPRQSLDARFGESIALLGYDLSASDLGPGRYVDVTFYWRALKPMSADYTLAIQLAAVATGDTRTLLNFNTWHGAGNLPTAAWPAGLAIVDRYRVPLPLDTGATQAWRLQALVYDAQTGARLPLTIKGQPAPVGEALTLSVVRVAGASVVSLPNSAQLSTPVTFDQAVALTHAQVDGQADRVRVQLLWQSLTLLPRDVTVFVHATAANGKQIATGDGPPMNNSFPTSLWKKGDQVLDEHMLTLPDGLTAGDVQIQVGLYRTEDGARLTALQNNTRLPNDAVTISPR